METTLLVCCSKEEFNSDLICIKITDIENNLCLEEYLDLLKKNFVGGAVSLCIGIAILVLGWLATQIVLLVLGILIAVKGLFALLDVLKKKKKNALQIVYPALSIAVGIMLAFGNGLDIMIVIVGILLAIDGVIGLMGSLKK